ncbi:hypothetical protein LIER_25820 [Lithospermum erythrorhizon]|uniref:WAT1-related protein n=1 Tax=Lithospermum erythrorhizon TaxID=34254 RepID=A0AAV3R981_LITER
MVREIPVEADSLGVVFSVDAGAVGVGTTVVVVINSDGQEREPSTYPSRSLQHNSKSWFGNCVQDRNEFLFVFQKFVKLVAYIQAPIQKEYSPKLRLTTLQCFFSSIASGAWGFAETRSFTPWKLGWDINLVAVVYSGLLVCAIGYWLQVWLVDKKGPVFVAMFGPLALIMTGVFSAIIFKEILHWGNMLGAVMLVAGLYSFLWGRNKESKAMKLEEAKLDGNHSHKQNIDNNVILECITTDKATYDLNDGSVIKQ